MNDQRKKKTSHKEKIKQYLLDGNFLTRIKCAKLGMGMDLSTRISELKRDGVPVSDRYTDGSCKEKEYFIKQNDALEYKQSTK